MNTTLQKPKKIVLPRGACVAIANKTGLKPGTVRAVINGYRNNAKVIEAATEYLNTYGPKS